MGVMRGEGRANHPSRGFVFDAIKHEYGARHFNWLDIGTVGMVDYGFMSDSSAQFSYTGVDISPPIIEDSTPYLRHERDRIVEWDIQQSLDQPSPFEPDEKFDLLTMRHIVNHCADYTTVIENAKRLLTDDGLFIITLHIPLTEKPSVILNHDGYPTDEPGNVIRHHINRTEFSDTVIPLFEFINFTRFRDPTKPNDVLILRNIATPSRKIPRTQNVQMRSLIWRVTRTTTPKFARTAVQRILGRN